jgi:hypothetical protein
MWRLANQGGASLDSDPAVQLRWKRSSLEFIFPKNVTQPSAFVDFYVVPVLTQQMDQFPDIPNTLLGA